MQHIGYFLVAQRVTEAPGRDFVDFGCPADDAEPSAWIAWYRAGAETLVAVLGDTPPETPMWSWGADQHAAFWARRMAHETMVHSVDAHLSVGAEFTIDPALAVDGVDGDRDAGLPDHEVDDVLHLERDRLERGPHEVGAGGPASHPEDRAAGVRRTVTTPVTRVWRCVA